MDVDWDNGGGAEYNRRLPGLDHGDLQLHRRQQRAPGQGLQARTHQLLLRRQVKPKNSYS